MDDKPPLYVVRITGRTSAGAEVSGTGFLVDEDAHVVTCRHVVFPTADAQPIANLTVRLPGTQGVTIAYQVCASESEQTAAQADIVVLASVVPLAVPTPQAMIDPDWAADTAIGDAVTVWGYSAAEHYLAPQRFDCHISGFAEKYGRIGLAGDINPGDSGAPVLNAERQVIGIAQAKDSKRDGQAMAIPISLALSLLEEITGRPLVGGKRPSGIFLAPRKPDDHQIVGRGPLLAQIRNHLWPGHGAVLCFKPGVGKSALAIELANDPDVRQRFPAGVLWASLNLHPNILTELKKWGVALGIPVERMNQLNSLPPPPSGADGPGDAAGSTAASIEMQWAAAITEQIGERQMLLIIDDAWEYESARSLTLDAPNCAHLITTRERNNVAGRLEQKFFVKVVQELDDDDALALVGQLAPKAVAKFPEKAREVVEAVGGLPQGLLLLGLFLGRESDQDRPRRILEAFEEIEANLHAHIAPLDAAIGLSYNALPNDAARRALAALSIFRPKPNTFSEAAALAVIDGPAKLLDALSDAGLIETVKSESDEGEPPYTMHRTIAEFGRTKLDDEESKALNQHAAAHFRHWLKDYDENERAPGHYLSQYRYEEPSWQEAMDDYLYHLTSTGDPRASAFAFAGIYFDAFWWWGCYLDFPFCTRLLKQADLRKISPAAREVLDGLCAFDAAYPKETRRDQNANWAQVEDALNAIRRLGGLDGEAEVPADEDARHLRAITDIFLAEACRFGRRDFTAAEKWYLDATQLLSDDDWSKPWALFHVGDLYLDHGRPDDAKRNCDDAFALAAEEGTPPKERDNELIANAYRLAAEVAVEDGDFARALDCYERAVLYAYVFQAVPSPPDAYTVEFYRMVCERTASGLQRLREKDPEQARRLGRGLFDFWASYRQLAGLPAQSPSDQELDALLGAEDGAALRALLFPPPPATADMHVAGSRYFNEAITVFGEKIAGGQGLAPDPGLNTTPAVTPNRP